MPFADGDGRQDHRWQRLHNFISKHHRLPGGPEFDASGFSIVDGNYTRKVMLNTALASMFSLLYDIAIYVECMTERQELIALLSTGEFMAVPDIAQVGDTIATLQDQETRIVLVEPDRRTHPNLEPSEVEQIYSELRHAGHLGYSDSKGHSAHTTFTEDPYLGAWWSFSDQRTSTSNIADYTMLTTYQPSRLPDHFRGGYAAAGQGNPRDDGVVLLCSELYTLKPSMIVLR